MERCMTQLVSSDRQRRRAAFNALDFIYRRGHAVTLKFEGTRIHYPVALADVDGVYGSCLIDVTGLGDVDAKLTRHQPFVLQARSKTGLLTTSAMQCSELHRRSERWAIRCALPEHIVESQERMDWRAALTAGMHAAVDIGWSGASAAGRLRDLSVSGCRIVLDRGTISPKPEARVRVRVNFPNGETLATDGWIVRDDDQNTIAVAFDDGHGEVAREVWFYVREIEREAARQTQKPRGELRYLAPSRLFHQPDRPIEESDSKVE
jgi:hypothetical protein